VPCATPCVLTVTTPLYKVYVCVNPVSVGVWKNHKVKSSVHGPWDAYSFQYLYIKTNVEWSRPCIEYRTYALYSAKRVRRCDADERSRRGTRKESRGRARGGRGAPRKKSTKHVTSSS